MAGNKIPMPQSLVIQRLKECMDAHTPCAMATVCRILPLRYERGVLTIAMAADGQDPETSRSFVRPWNTFGVRMRARIATCGPPRAALVVLENARPPALRAVKPLR